MPCFQTLITEHTDRRRNHPAQAGQRDMHAHVLLCSPRRCKVLMAQIPAEIGPCQRGT